MPDRPQVTITNPHAAFGEPLPSLDSLPTQRIPRLALAVGAVALVVLLTAGYAVTAIAKADDDRADAEGRLLRIGVVSALAGLEAHQPAVDRRNAAVDLTVTNLGPLPVTVLRQQLDGGPPVDHGPGTTLAPRGQQLLRVRWQIRCSQVGTVFGPGSLTLTLRAPRGDHELQLALDQTVDAAFHQAADLVCAP